MKFVFLNPALSLTDWPFAAALCDATGLEVGAGAEG